MEIFIDFDDVIFNTKKFRDDLADVFFNNGIVRDVYEETYYDPEDDRSLKVYDPRAQIVRIKKKIDIDEKKLAESIDLFMKDTSVYVFGDFISFVDCFGRENIHVISFGNKDFLEEKIKSSGIRKYADNIFLTDGLKSMIISEMMKMSGEKFKEKLFFIDDRAEQIADIKEKFPQIMTILLKRPEGRYQDTKEEKICDFEAHDLKEAREIIEKITS